MARAKESVYKQVKQNYNCYKLTFGAGVDAGIYITQNYNQVPRTIIRRNSEETPANETEDDSEQEEKSGNNKGVRQDIRRSKLRLLQGTVNLKF